MVENDENASEDSKSDANLSEYEERIRRNRDLPSVPPTDLEPSASPAVRIPSRTSAKPTSPVLSPRNASPYLTDGDYGIKLDFPDAITPDELLMTNELISKVPFMEITFFFNCKSFTVAFHQDGGLQLIGNCCIVPACMDFP